MLDGGHKHGCAPYKNMLYHDWNRHYANFLINIRKIDLNDVSVFQLSSNIFSRSRLSEKDTRIFMFDLYFYRLCPIPNSNLFTECSYVWRVMDAKQETFILLTKPVSNIWIHAISSIYVYSLTCWFTRFRNCRSTDA